MRQVLHARWRGRHVDVVEDAVQEALFECLRPGGALARFDPRRGELGTYLDGVVRNVASRFERREGRFMARHGGVADLAEVPGDGEPAARLGRERTRNLVQAEIASLDREMALPGHSFGELIRLHFREGMPVRQIAALWHVLPARVHELRRAACHRLRRRLARLGR